MRRAGGRRACTDGSHPNTRSRLGEHLVHGPQALDIQVGVHPAEVVEQEIPDGIGSHDRIGVAVVDRKKPRIVLLEKGAAVRVGPQPVVPSRVMPLPRPCPVAPSGGYIPVPPRLVDQRRNASRLRHPHRTPDNVIAQSRYEVQRRGQECAESTGRVMISGSSSRPSCIPLMGNCKTLFSGGVGTDTVALVSFQSLFVRSLSRQRATPLSVVIAVDAESSMMMVVVEVQIEIGLVVLYGHRPRIPASG